MPSFFLSVVGDRVRQLTETLYQLKDRVREAVATEAGRIVGEAVRDVLTAALRVPVVETARPRDPNRPRWADDADARWGSSLADRPAASVRANAAAAASAAVLAARWLWRRQVAAWACLAVGLAAGAAALCGHPLVQAVLSAVGAATEVVSVVHPDPT